MPRPCKCRYIGTDIRASIFKPQGIPLCEVDEVVLPLDAFEALRLADHVGMPTKQAAHAMGVSRHTFGRLLAKARQTVAQALTLGLALRIEGVDYAVQYPAPETACSQPSNTEAAPHTESPHTEA